ncbi:MAG: redoxin domain-containing protein [Pseudomonadota bacterium]
MSPVLALLLAGCVPHLYSPVDTGDTDWSWEAPENTWPMGEPPFGLRGQAYEQGKVAPDFRLLDQHGDEVSLWQFYGMVVVLDHSTMWCAQCQDLARDAEDTWQTYLEQGFMYLTLLPEDTDHEVPDVEDLQYWGDYFGLSAPILADDAGIALQVTAGTFPQVQVIDRTMRVAVEEVTPLSDAQIRAEVEELL